jgi:Flp pilus assembly protein TadG
MKLTVALWGAHGKKRSGATRICTSSIFRDEGQALVEAALVLPVILIAATGILVFGIFMMQVMSLNEGVANAGRVLAVSSGLTTDPCALAAQAVQNAGSVLTSTNLSYKLVLNPGTGNQTSTLSSCSSSSTTTGMAGALVSGGTVTVQATYSGCSLTFYGNRLMPNGCSITQSVTEIVQ